MRHKVFGHRPVSAKRRAQGCPEYTDQIPRRALFSVQGSTGWRRRRDISGHKGNRSEQNFSDQDGKWTEEEA